VELSRKLKKNISPNHKLGLATYGRGWVLPEGTEETGLYCPAVGGIPMGPYTRQDGTWSYYEVLQVWIPPWKT
jgi:hypothetical protein